VFSDTESRPALAGYHYSRNHQATRFGSQLKALHALNTKGLAARRSHINDPVDAMETIVQEVILGDGRIQIIVGAFYQGDRMRLSTTTRRPSCFDTPRGFYAALASLG